MVSENQSLENLDNKPVNEEQAAISGHVWAELAMNFPEPSASFFDVGEIDKQAERQWQAIANKQGSDLSLVRSYRSLVGNSARERMEALNQTAWPNIKDNLCVLGGLDPDKDMRKVPAGAPGNPNQSAYITEHGQRSLLLYHTLKNPAKTIPGKSPQKMADAEVVWQAGATLDAGVAGALHQNAIDGLEGEVLICGKKYPPIFDKPYTAAERKNIAARPELGLNEAEVEELHKRLEAAKAGLLRKP